MKNQDILLHEKNIQPWDGFGENDTKTQKHLSLYDVNRFPTIDELEYIETSDLTVLLDRLNFEITVLLEEERILKSFEERQNEDDKRSRISKVDLSESGNSNIMERGALGGAVPTGMVENSSSTAVSRRGLAYKRKSMDYIPVFLTTEEKESILQHELGLFQKQKNKQRMTFTEAEEILQATAEEAKNRIEEIKVYDFLLGREFTFSSAVVLEKLESFLANILSRKNSRIRKFAGKSIALQHAINKLTKQMLYQGDSGEIHHPIDFEQIKIENEQLSERIDQRNSELVDLKGSSTRTVQILNTMTERLNSMNLEQIKLLKVLETRKQHVEKIKNEIQVVLHDEMRAKRHWESLKKEHESMNMPKVENYIAQKAEQYELEKAFQNGCRKLEVAVGQVNVMKQQLLAYSHLLGKSVF